MRKALRKSQKDAVDWWAAGLGYADIDELARANGYESHGDMAEQNGFKSIFEFFTEEGFYDRIIELKRNEPCNFTPVP
jgi:hypothetical protein